jgi:hypothetical protein
MSSTLHVPRDAFDHFQAALRRESRQFITDCANILKIPPNQLIKEVQEKMKAQPMTVSLLETEENPGCLAYLQEGTFAYRCRAPCLTNSKMCHKHQTTRITTDDKKAVKKLVRLKTYDGLPALWFDKETTEVYNVHQQCVGNYDESTGQLKMLIPTDG